MIGPYSIVKPPPYTLLGVVAIWCPVPIGWFPADITGFFFRITASLCEAPDHTGLCHSALLLSDIWRFKRQYSYKTDTFFCKTHLSDERALLYNIGKDMKIGGLKNEQEIV